MAAQRQFSSRVFWLSYAGFVLFWVFVEGRFDPLDLTGTMLFVCAIIFPIPFILFGYFARSGSFSILYALAALLASYVMFFHGVPLLDRLLDPRSRTTEQHKEVTR